MYRRFTDLEVENYDGSVTKYNLEVAGPNGGRIEQIVISNSPHNQGPPVHLSDVEIGKQVAEQAGKDITKMNMFVEQADGKYLLRTFREYNVGHAPEKLGEVQQTMVDANNKDREGKLFTQQEVDKYTKFAEVPHDHRPSINNPGDDARRYDLSKESFSVEHRPPPEIENER